MTDPSSGRAFYVDHANKITTWQRPVAATKSSKPASISTSTSTSTYPNVRANPTSSTASNYGISNRESSAYYGREQQQQQLQNNTYSNEDAGYHFDSLIAADESPTPDFVVRKIGDKERMECPQCHSPFTTRKRRHHCRLCGDVFCHACSSHQCSLPLDGTEFDKPVRVCDLCFKDVDRGNYFSMRRYLPPLQLHDPGASTTVSVGTNTDEINSADHAVAALGAIASDLDSILRDSSSFEEKITIPAPVLVPAICRHIDSITTQEHSIRVLSTLLTIGNLVGSDTFTRAVYTCEVDVGSSTTKNNGVIDMILKILERNASTRQVASAQVQAARALFHLTNPTVIEGMLTKGKDEEVNNNSSGGAAEFYAELAAGQQEESKNESVVVNEIDESTITSALDVHRALRCVLDHSAGSDAPSLQRWSAASIQHLIAEDRRRAMDKNTNYKSFIPQIISTGGILILCSLMCTNDADTRAHATAALASIVVNARALDSNFASSSELMNARLVASIVSADGCGTSLAQLLFSSDDTIVRMGCSFAASLVSPLLSSVIISSNRQTNDTEAYYNAAFALANDGACLSALVEIIRPKNSKTRSTELIGLAMETLAAICVAYCSQNTEGTDVSRAEPTSIMKLESENVGLVALELLSSSAQSISSQDSPSARMREAAGIAICAMCFSSKKCAFQLLQKRSISLLLSAASDENMQRPSTLREGKAARCLPLLEAVSALLSQAIIALPQKQSSASTPRGLDCLLEALDAGIVPLLSRLMISKIEFHSDKAPGDVSMKVVSCLMIDSMLGVVFSDNTYIGGSRFYDAIIKDAESGTWGSMRGNLISTTISLLHANTVYMQNDAAGTDWFDASNPTSSAILKLEESCLLAVGSLCGARSWSSRGSDESLRTTLIAPKAFDENCHDACVATCGILFDEIDVSIFTTMLVGGYGEGCITPTLRLLVALSVNGSEDLHLKLTNSGMLIPVSDLLRNALNNGDTVTVSGCLGLLQCCGPHVSIDSGDGGGTISCVHDVVRVASAIIKTEDNGPSQSSSLSGLKQECLYMLEALSGNASLWNVIASEAFSSLAVFLCLNIDYMQDKEKCEALISTLRIVQGVIPLPSNGVAADRCGLTTAIAGLCTGGGDAVSKVESPVIDEALHVQMVALGVLRILAGNVEVRHGDGQNTFGLIDSGVVTAACCTLSYGGTLKSSPFAGSIAQAGLELLMDIVVDLKPESQVDDLYRASASSAFVEAISHQSKFIRVLVATMLDEEHLGSDNNDLTVPPGATEYGAPLVCLHTQCAGYPDTRQAAIGCLVSIGEQCSAFSTSEAGKMFWRVFLLQDVGNDKLTTSASSAVACAFLLSRLTDETRVGNSETVEQADTHAVQKRLLDGLRTSLESAPNDESTRSILCKFRVPALCVVLSNSSSPLKKSATNLIGLIGSRYPELMSNMATDEASLRVMFEALANESSPERFEFANLLFALSEENSLGVAVKQNNLRKYAISCLTGACSIRDKEVNGISVEKLRLASLCMGCIISILAVDNETNDISLENLRIGEDEGKVIATSTASAISLLVSARLKHGDDELDLPRMKVGVDEYMEPEILLLCTLASCEEAIAPLCINGAVPALCAIVSDGDFSALQALRKASSLKPALVLEANGHLAVIRLLSGDIESTDEAKTISLNILSEICEGSRYRTNIVSDSADDCIHNCVAFLADNLPADENIECQSNENLDTENIPPESNDVENGSPINIYEKKAPLETSIGGAVDEKLDEFDGTLKLAVLSFLAQMITIKRCREMIIQEPRFLQAVINVAKTTSNQSLEFHAVAFLSSISPFIHEVDNKDTLVSLFISALEKKTPISRASTKFGRKSLSTEDRKNRNILLSKAVDGLECHIESIPSTVALVDILCQCCTTLISEVSIGLSNSLILKDSGRLMASCTSIFILLTGSASNGKEVLMRVPVLQMLVRLALINPKQLSTDLDPECWLLARNQTLFCLAALMRWTACSTDIEWSDVISQAEGKLSKVGTAKKIASKSNFGRRASASNESNGDSRSGLRGILDEIIREGADRGSSIAAEKILQAIG